MVDNYFLFFRNRFITDWRAARLGLRVTQQAEENVSHDLHRTAPNQHQCPAPSGTSHHSAQASKHQCAYHRHHDNSGKSHDASSATHAAYATGAESHAGSTHGMYAEFCCSLQNVCNLII